MNTLLETGKIFFTESAAGAGSAADAGIVGFVDLREDSVTDPKKRRRPAA